jgi:hypothetical protein
VVPWPGETSREMIRLQVVVAWPPRTSHRGAIFAPIKLRYLATRIGKISCATNSEERCTRPHIAGHMPHKLVAFCDGPGCLDSFRGGIS